MLIKYVSYRMAPIVYASEGKDISEQLWKETLAEFSFAGVEGILEDISR